ncbi:NTF2-like N-terminal transpeptidase domain-containing protein [Kitasatospora arboriphila]
MIEYEDAEYEDAEYGSEGAAAPGRRRAVRIGVAVVCGTMLAVGGFGVYNIAGAVRGGSGGGSAKPTTSAAAAATRAPTAQEAATAAKGFLDAWGRGDLAAAAALTDRPDMATSTLSSFQQELHPSEFTLTPTGAVSAAPQPGRTAEGFHARMRFQGTDRAWEYDGSLGVVRTDEGRIAVHWDPSVIHPSLAAGGSIAVRTVDALPGRLVDRNGKPFEESSPVKAMLA